MTTRLIRNPMFLVAFLALTVTSAHAAEPSAQITFEKDKMIEVVFAKIKPGKMAELQESYFPRIMPIAMSYGAKPLGTLKVDTISHGPDNANLFGFFEWPSVEAKQRFEQNKEAQSLIAYRDTLLESLKITYTHVEETTTVTFHEDRLYEIGSLWINKQNAGLLNEYFDAAGPFIQANNVRFLAEFKPTGSPKAYHMQPDMMFLIEWPSAATKDRWFESEQFRQVGWKRALALDRLYIVEGHFNFPEQAQADPNPAPLTQIASE